MFFRLLSLVYYRPGELKALDMGDKSTYLGRNDQGTEEDPLVCPLLESDVDMRASAVEICEGSEDHGKLNLCANENLVNEGGERRVVAAAFAAECSVDGFLDCTDEVV